MTSVGTAFVDIKPDMSQFSGALTSGMGNLSGLAKSLGGNMGKLLGVGAVVGVGAELVHLGDQFKTAYNTIQTGTGATGKELDKLKTSFKNVAGSGLASFTDVATAITGVKQRLDLTGKPLEDVSTKFTQLARFTGTDLKTSIASVSDVLKGFNIPAADTGKAMDKLYRATQATGVPLESLTASVKKFRVPLQEMGFGFDQSLALVGKFGKEGLNTDKVMASMSIGLAKMAKAGEDPKTAFNRLTGEIKGATDVTEANSLAIKVFGARAGPQLADAIRSGKFEIGDLTKTIASGSSTLKKSAEETKTWGGSWKITMNMLKVELEPLASFLTGVLNLAFRAFGAALAAVFKAIEQIGASRGFKDWMSQIADIAHEVWVNVKAFADIFMVGFTSGSRNLTGLMGTIAQFGETVRGVVDWIRGNWQPVLAGVGLAALALVAPLVAVGVGLVALYHKFQGFRDVVQSVVDWVVANWPTIQATALNVFGAVVAAGTVVIAWMQNNLIPMFQSAVKWVQDNWSKISQTISDVFTIVKFTVEVSLAIIAANIYAAVLAIQFIWNNFGDQIVAIIKTAWSYISGIVSAAMTVIQGIIHVVSSLIKGDWSGVWEGIQEIFRGIWAAIVTTLNFGLETIKNLLSLAWAIVQTGFSVAWAAVLLGIRTTWDLISSIVSGSWSFVKDTVLQPAWDWITGTFSKVWDTFLGATTSVWDTVKSVLRGALSEIGGIVSGFLNTVGDIAGAVGLPFADIFHTAADSAKSWGSGGGGGTGRDSKGQVGGFVGRFAEGGIPASTVGAGFMTNGPRAIVGEGSPVHPEFVIPTDPTHRSRALDLYQSLGFQLMAGGGVFGTLGDIGSGIVGGIEGGVDWVKDNVVDVFRRIAAGALEKVWPKLPQPDGLAGLPSSGINTVRQAAIDFIKGEADKKQKASAPSGGASGAPSGPVPPGAVSDWINQAIGLTGVPAAWSSGLYPLAMFESGGDPHSINLTDSNAQKGTPSKGLAQTIDSTFQEFMVPGHGDIWNPVDNMAAAIRYIQSRYGDVWRTPGMVSIARGGGYVGYASGGVLPASWHPASFDQGGTLAPGWNHVRNDTGRPETLTPAGRQGPALHIEHATFTDDVDVDVVLAKTDFLVRSGRL